MKTLLITLAVVVVLGALAYLIVKANQPEIPPIVEVTTPPATIVQPIYVQREHHHSGGGM